jgi:hypothetical protein
MPAPTKKYRKSTKKTRRNIGRSINSTKERLKYFDDDERYEKNDKNDKNQDDENDEDEFCTIM